jgi:hypothetical protein
VRTRAIPEVQAWTLGSPRSKDGEAPAGPDERQAELDRDGRRSERPRDGAGTHIPKLAPPFVLGTRGTHVHIDAEIFRHRTQEVRPLREGINEHNRSSESGEDQPGKTGAAANIDDGVATWEEVDERS